MSDLTCPYCEATIDHDRADLWEYENEDEIECPECEKSFILLVEVTYEYTGRRHECQNGEHEYDEWVRMDIDQATLDRWSKDPTMKEFSKEEPYSYYARDCNNCDETDYSENMPLGTELAQDQIRSR
ncbi:hypothetical protein PHAGE_JEFFCO_52 [Acinetobacter phage JeffCo]|nr:hypothetical protein PHAGE_JEFFCO_52 [Acinetobacter phage JeffCo]